MGHRILTDTWGPVLFLEAEGLGIASCFALLLSPCVFILCISTLGGLLPAPARWALLSSLPCSKEGYLIFSTHPTNDHSIDHADPRCQALAGIGCVHYLESFRPFCKDRVIIPILQLRQMKLEDEMICPGPHGQEVPEPRTILCTWCRLYPLSDSPKQGSLIGGGLT